MKHKLVWFLVLLLTVAALQLPARIAAQGGGTDGAPGFAVGTFDNGHAYALAQTFSVPHGGMFYGAVLAFGETQGAPSGAVRWELRRWYGAIGYMGRVLATGAWEPTSLAWNSIPASGIRLEPGEYALVLRAAERQDVGSYWVVLASDGAVDLYPGGDLLQLQADGGVWGVWPGQDIYGVIDVAGASGMWLALAE